LATLRGGIGYPQDSCDRFPRCIRYISSPFPKLAWRNVREEEKGSGVFCGIIWRKIRPTPFLLPFLLVEAPDMSWRSFVSRVYRLPDYLGWRAQEALRKLCQVDCYQLRGGTLVRTMGITREESVALEDIVAWWVIHEMTFDVVYLRLANAQLMAWPDVNGDLLSLLRSVAQQREHERP
jgi:hypothetical protein